MAQTPLSSPNDRRRQIQQRSQERGDHNIYERGQIQGSGSVGSIRRIQDAITTFASKIISKETWNNFTSLPERLSQLSHLITLVLDGCKKLEVFPKLPPSVWNIYACDCTLGSYKDPFRSRVNVFSSCPKLFKNDTVNSEGSSIFKTQCLDSSITSQGLNNHLSVFLGYLGFETKRGEFLFQGTGLLFKFMGIAFQSGLEIEVWKIM
ncbi:NB-ARC domains-containing protein [Tanacetum coccineum]